MDSAADTPCGVGCPIRRSLAQSLLAAPQGFSQRATSFIASWRQGIHQMPLLSSSPASHHHRPPPHEVCDFTGAPAASAQRLQDREGKGRGRRRMIPATTTKRAVRARNGPHTHARCASCLQTEETTKNGRTRDLPMPVAQRMHGDHGSRHAPCPQRAPLTTSRCPNNKACHALASCECGNAWWAWADLNGRPHAYQACALTS